MSLRFHPDAYKEMLEAARYYEARVEILGEDSLFSVESSPERIQEDPRVGSSAGSGKARLH
jgi:hypothetical protein